jgi:hypothetical protein
MQLLIQLCLKSFEKSSHDKMPRHCLFAVSAGPMWGKVYYAKYSWNDLMWLALFAKGCTYL